MEIAIVNGPNLNLLGKREVDIYGSQDFETFFKSLQKTYSSHKLQYFQSNEEGALINFLQNVGFEIDGIIINPAGFSHTSVALADAVAAIPCDVVEVHISNIFARESFRHHSFISANARGVISGMGLEGYRLAIDFLVNRQ